VSTLNSYLDEIRAFKRALFGAYEAEGCRFERKIPARAGGTTWGYRLTEWNGRRLAAKATGSSIGEDEIRVIHDIVQLTRPTSVYIIGNAFGFSTICFALAAPGARVVAIDNWSEGDDSLAARDLTLKVAAQRGLTNVHLHTGSSPDDTPAAMTEGKIAGKLSIFFIDGMHTDEAAFRDFVGALPYLDATSVVLWHNAYSVRNGFRSAYEQHGNKLFDRNVVLRTYGPLGVTYHAGKHAELDRYFQETSLLWNDWDRFIGAFKATEKGAQRGFLRRTIARLW
jgi:predicted O-methyltransferase YrrM